MNRIVKTAVSGAAFAVAAAAAFAPNAANAQTATLEPVQRPFSLKIGAAWPSGGDSDTQFKAGAAWDFTKATTVQPLLFNVYVDYYGSSDQHVLGGGVGAKYMLGLPTAPSAPYVGVGIGAYDTHVSGSSDKTSFGGKVLAGYQFNAGYFGEVDYTFLNKNNGSNPSALGLAVGYRF